MSFVGGQSKMDIGAERRTALDKETMAAIYGKWRLSVHLKSHTVWVGTTFEFELTLQPLKKTVCSIWIKMWTY